MLYIVSIIFIILVQLIYTNGTDVPFYYKEIMYDWNYSTSHNTKFDKKVEWVSLLNTKGQSINVIKEQERTTLIQTDLFSQQYSNIHEYLNTAMLILLIIMIVYIVYTSMNATMYKHEKIKIIRIITGIVLFVAVIIYIYNTELLTSILYKTHFTYTDNIYVNNEKETKAFGIIIIIVGLVLYYIKVLKQINKKTISRYAIYVLIVAINIINENTLIGLEYLYFIIYIELLLLITYLIMNRKTY